MLDSHYARSILGGDPIPAEIWDCHGHLDAVRYHFIPGRPDAESLVGFMDRLGMRALCFSHHLVVTGDLEEGNRLACEAASRFPGRLLVYLGFNPNYPLELSIRELERYVGHPHVVGIKFHTSTHQASPDDPRYRPAFEFARQHELVILSHVWGTREVTGCEKMLDEFPSVPFIIGHSGGYEYAAMYEAVRVAREHPNAYLDLCLSGFFDGVVELFVREAGVDRVLFGSDVPFMDPRGNLGRVAFARIPDEAKEKILARNLKNLLGRRASG